MTSTIVRYLPLGLRAARILLAVASRIAESSPQEREEIWQRMLAIYTVLTNVAKRAQQSSRLPSVPQLPPPSGWSPTSENHKHRELRQAMRQFGKTIG